VAATGRREVEVAVFACSARPASPTGMRAEIACAGSARPVTATGSRAVIATGTTAEPGWNTATMPTVSTLVVTLFVELYAWFPVAVTVLRCVTSLTAASVVPADAT
jgi:hypothetical protein